MKTQRLMVFPIGLLLSCAIGCIRPPVSGLVPDGGTAPPVIYWEEGATQRFTDIHSFSIAWCEDKPNCTRQDDRGPCTAAVVATKPDNKDRSRFVGTCKISKYAEHDPTTHKPLPKPKVYYYAFASDKYFTAHPFKQETLPNWFEDNIQQCSPKCMTSPIAK